MVASANGMTPSFQSFQEASILGSLALSPALTNSSQNQFTWIVGIYSNSHQMQNSTVRVKSQSYPFQNLNTTNPIVEDSISARILIFSLVVLSVSLLVMIAVLIYCVWWTRRFYKNFKNSDDDKIHNPLLEGAGNLI